MIFARMLLLPQRFYMLSLQCSTVRRPRSELRAAQPMAVARPRFAVPGAISLVSEHARLAQLYCVQAVQRDFSSKRGEGFARASTR